MAKLLGRKIERRAFANQLRPALAIAPRLFDPGLLLTRQLAVEYGPRGINVNAICPGFIPDTGSEINVMPGRIESLRRCHMSY